jgi:hypothetical protein
MDLGRSSVADRLGEQRERSQSGWARRRELGCHHRRRERARHATVRREDRLRRHEIPRRFGRFGQAEHHAIRCFGCENDGKGCDDSAIASPPQLCARLGPPVRRNFPGARPPPATILAYQIFPALQTFGIAMPANAIGHPAPVPAEQAWQPIFICMSSSHAPAPRQYIATESSRICLDLNNESSLTNHNGLNGLATIPDCGFNPPISLRHMLPLSAGNHPGNFCVTG